jgi:DNA repair protein RecO (recombination protein O)
MTFETTEAIALRISPYSNTSHVVTWLTPRRGRLGTIFKGAMRPRSAFLGQYDLFYTCEIIFYARDNNGLHIARDCYPLKLRQSFRKDWRAAIIASYVCDFVSRVSLTGGHNPELYRLLSRLLDFMAENGAALQLVFWFELRLLEILGLAPRLSNCAACGVAVTASHPAVFSVSRGGILCADCARKPDVTQQEQFRDRHGPENTTMKPDELAVLRAWLGKESPRPAFNTRIGREQMIAFRRVLGIFLARHLDLEPASRETALRMLMTGTTAANPEREHQ